MKDLTFFVILALFCVVLSQKYFVKVIQKDSEPLISYLVTNNSIYKQVFNPTWIPPSPGTNNRKGLLARSQNCDFDEQKCIFCGGSANKASVLTFSEDLNGKFTPIDK